jgi:hypothetical protein
VACVFDCSGFENECVLLSFVWEVGGDGEVSLEVFLVLAVVWEELFQFSVEAFLVEVLEMDGLVDYDVLCELGWYGEDLLVVG